MTRQQPHVLERKDERRLLAQAPQRREVEVSAVEVVTVGDVPVVTDELGNAVAAGIIEVLETERLEPSQRRVP